MLDLEIRAGIIQVLRTQMVGQRLNMWDSVAFPRQRRMISEEFGSGLGDSATVGFGDVPNGGESDAINGVKGGYSIFFVHVLLPYLPSSWSQLSFSDPGRRRRRRRRDAEEEKRQANLQPPDSRLQTQQDGRRQNLARQGRPPFERTGDLAGKLKWISHRFAPKAHSSALCSGGWD